MMNKPRHIPQLHRWNIQKGKHWSITVLAFALGIGIALSVVSIDHFYIAILLIITLVFLALLPVIHSIMARKFDLFEPINIFIIWYLLSFAVGASGAFSQEIRKLYFLQENDAFYWLSLALSYSIIGLLFFFLGYLSTFGNRLARAIPIISMQSWSRRKLRSLVYIFTLIGLVSYGTVLQQLGGIQYVLTHIDAIRRKEVLAFSGIGYLTIWQYFLVVVNLMWHLWAITTSQKSKMLWIHTLITLIIIGSFGSRTHIMAYLAALLVLYHYLVRKINLKQALVFFLCSIVFLQLYVAFRRNLSWDLLASPSTVVKTFFGDLSAIRVFIRLLQVVPDKFPHEGGHTYLEMARNLMYLPFPRMIFPNKPIILSLADYMGQKFFPEFPSEQAPGLPPSFLGEQYLNFSVLGIVIGMFVFGLFCRVIYSYIGNGTRKGVQVLLYSIVLPYIGVAVFSSAQAAIQSLILLLIPAIILLLLVEGRRKTSVNPLM